MNYVLTFAYIIGIVLKESLEISALILFPVMLVFALLYMCDKLTTRFQKNTGKDETNDRC